MFKYLLVSFLFVACGRINSPYDKTYTEQEDGVKSPLSPISFDLDKEVMIMGNYSDGCEKPDDNGIPRCKLWKLRTIHENDFTFFDAAATQPVTNRGEFIVKGSCFIYTNYKLKLVGSPLKDIVADCE